MKVGYQLPGGTRPVTLILPLCLLPCTTILYENLPGRIPTKDAEELIEQGGPQIIIRPGEHPHQWIRPSYFCPNEEYGIIFGVNPPGLPRMALIRIYTGTSNLDLNLSSSEAEELWKDSDYVLSSRQRNYDVNGDLSSGAARVNEGFETTNSFLSFNDNDIQFEMRINGYAGRGYYEGLGNYTEAGVPSSCWTAQRVSQLPKGTRVKRQQFYPNIATSFLSRKKQKTLSLPTAYSENASTSSLPFTSENHTTMPEPNNSPPQLEPTSNELIHSHPRPP